MRSLLRAGLAAAFAAILVFGTSFPSPAQPPSEVDQLVKQVGELRKAGKYSEAIPLPRKY
jgi:hypothetical protein